MKLPQGFQTCNETTLSAQPLVTVNQTYDLKALFFLIGNKHLDNIRKFSAKEAEFSGDGCGASQLWGAVEHVCVLS